eukprot:725716-Amphidinium_carterae.2
MKNYSSCLRRTTSTKRADPSRFTDFALRQQSRAQQSLPPAGYWQAMYRRSTWTKVAATEREGQIGIDPQCVD